MISFRLLLFSFVIWLFLCCCCCFFLFCLRYCAAAALTSQLSTINARATLWRMYMLLLRFTNHINATINGNKRVCICMCLYGCVCMYVLVLALTINILVLKRCGYAKKSQRQWADPTTLWARKTSTMNRTHKKGR